MSNTPPTSAQELTKECHQLVEAIARHRLNIKLLKNAYGLLTMLANYKANRTIRARLSSNGETK